MATRMQQRRGTASQWTTANPILNAGEIGFESDTNKFKIGDGTNHWADLVYFADVDTLGTALSGSYLEVTDIGVPSGVAGLDGSKNLLVPGASIIVEGATDNTNETTLTITDPTADRTITFPDSSGTVVLADGSGNVTVSGNLTVQGTTTTVDSTTINVVNSFTFEGSTADAYETTLTVTDPTADRTITFPDATGTVVLTTTLDEMAQDAVNTAIVAGTGLDKTYDDGANTITLDIDSTVTTNSGTQTLTNKTISLTNNTVSGTTAEFNTALSDANFVTTGDTGTVTSTMIANDTIVNADINSAAAIAYSKLNLTGSITSSDIVDGTIVDGDINASAAIAQSKISGLTTDLAAKAPLASPTFTGTVTLPSGTVTSGMIADGTIVNADISASAAIALSKLATDPLARANHTGTQTASTISDFDTQVRTSKVTDLAAPTGSFSMNSQKITSLATPTLDADAATKAYVDAATAGLNVHAAVQAATTAAVTLASGLENGDTLDGVTLATGNRVLVKNQADKTTNGIYIVAASGAPSRADDYNVAGEVDAGDFIFVEAGTVNGKTGWVQTNVITTLGSDNIEFTQFSGAGTYSAGTGLTLTGTTFSINTGTTVDLSTAQTLSNKSISLGSNTVTGTTAQFNTALSDGDFATLAGTETLTNKTINGTNNTITNVSLTTGVTGTLPVANGGTGITSLGTGIATFLGTPSSANLASAVTDETGSGALVFGTSPSFTTAITLSGTGELRLADSDSTHYVGFKSPTTVTTNRIWTLPSTDGTDGQTLSTNGSGTLTWSTPATGAAFSEMLLIGC